MQSICQSFTRLLGNRPCFHSRQIIAVARMSNVFNKLRHDSQLILDLKGLTPANSEETLPEVSDDLKQTLHDRSRKSFDEIKNLDKGND